MKVMGGDYEHTSGLGSAAHSGVVYEPRSLAECFGTVLSRKPFEASEFSLANYIIYKSTGDDWLSAVPVFPSRLFRHSDVLVRDESNITSFDQLAGKTIGVMDYSQTAAVWLRGILNDEYGVSWRDVAWVSSRVQRFATPAGVNIRTTETGIEKLLVAGEIDAAMLFSPTAFDNRNEDGGVRTLLPDAREVEREYYRRTQIFPIMHTVVINKTAEARELAAPRRIFDAYSHARKSAVRRKLGPSFLSWVDDWSDVAKDYDGNSHPYGLTPANRRVIETLVGYLNEQGFIPSKPAVNALFPPGADEWID